MNYFVEISQLVWSGHMHTYVATEYSQRLHILYTTKVSKGKSFVI